LFGAHQKLDRVARRHLDRLIPNKHLFPPIRQILQFEGKNGPDGIKRKSPGHDEPWHYYDPYNEADLHLLNQIEEHYEHLVKQLKIGNRERIAFEAAWLAHALVDGLTPAHHYPYEEKLAEIRGGEGMETRTTIKQKIIMPGDNRRQKIKNNWSMWGVKGLLITHWWFEFGIATLIKPLQFGDSVPSKSDVEQLKKYGLIIWFKRKAKEIAELNMYHRYYEKGWTPRLAFQVRHNLGPIIVQTITLAWYLALHDAGLIKPSIDAAR
jgi:hypothetical protein